MDFGEVLRTIRVEEKDSYRSLSQKTGITYSYFDKIERGVSPVNTKILEALIKVYPNRKEELVKAYCETKIPKFVYDTIRDSISADGTTSMQRKEIKIFTVLSNSDGILLPEYKLREMSTTVNINKNDFCVEVLGNEMDGFFEGDILLVEKTDKPWQLLNNKIVVITVDGKKYIKRVNIKDYKPVFESINGLYEPFVFDEKMKLVGIVTKLLHRNLA
ncbi:MAG: helix-turn-helix domain-containing protein [Cetobacterium sp.]